MDENKDTWEETEIPGMYVLSEEGRNRLAEYYKCNHERLRQEHQEMYKKLLAEDSLVETNQSEDSIVDVDECYESETILKENKESFFTKIYFILRSLFYGK